MASTISLRRREERGGRLTHKFLDPIRLDRQFLGVTSAISGLHSLLASGTPLGPAAFRAVKALVSATSTDAARDSALIFGAHVTLAALVSAWAQGTGEAELNPSASGSDVKLQTLREALMLLRDLGMSADEHPFRGHEPILGLFRLMRRPQLFESAAALTEEVLANRARLFPLSSVPDLGGFVMALAPVKLSAFSRVLAVLCYEPEETRHLDEDAPASCTSLLQMRRDRRSRSLGVLEQNQAAVMAVPGLMKRLVLVLRTMSWLPPLSDLSMFVVSTQLHNALDMLASLPSPTPSAGSWEELEERLEAAGNPKQNYSQRPPAPRQRNPILAILAPLLVASTVPSTGASAAGGRAAVGLMALQMAPHQTELLFLLTPLLGGRRSSTR